MLFQEIQPDRNILCLQMHTVISIGSHHSTGLVTDQRIYIQENIFRSSASFAISAFLASIPSLVI